MKLGYLTACLPRYTLGDLAALAKDLGYDALEVAAWPETGGRPFTATHIDVRHISEADVEVVRATLQKYNLDLSSLAYYDNNLHPDPIEREAIHRHLYRCIDAAQMLSCPTVGTFVGRDPTRTVTKNLREAEKIFRPITEYAGERGVKIVIENCVMEGWHPDGYPGNLAYSPELWEWMFDLGLYLNFDPSHLLWMGIDPAAALRPYVGNVAHAQAKDIQLYPDRRNKYGYPGKTVHREEPWDVGWWRYRVPGLGEVDWAGLIDILYEEGFDGVLSVEHEDPVWSGSEERVKVGLRIAHRALNGLVNVSRD